MSRIAVDQNRRIADASPTYRHIADFVLGDVSIPPSVLARAADLLLDTLGVAIAGSGLTARRIARDTACLLHGSANPEYAAPLLFDGRSASLAGAAFALAAQIDNLDAHDGFNIAKGHVGVVAVPGLLALAHHKPDLSGLDALAALVIGYEIAGRAGTALHASCDDYHTSGAWNALGVAAMASRLRDLDAGQLRHALGIAEFHGPRSQMMREIANPTMLHDGSGWGALAGVSGAIMAERGFHGAPALTIEVPELAAQWADLGKVWQVPEHYIKPYPVCRWAHAALDAAKALRERHRIAPDTIAGVEVHSFAAATRLFDVMPDTGSQAQYSLHWAVACLLAHGTVAPAHLDPPTNDPVLRAVLASVRAIEDPAHEARFPADRIARVTIRLHDGRRFDSGDVQARGGAPHPFATSDIIAKFDSYAAPVLGVARACAIREAALSLARPETRLCDLARHLNAPVDPSETQPMVNHVA